MKHGGGIRGRPQYAWSAGRRLAAYRPLARQARTQRIELAADTPNRSAAARLDGPPATAAISRDRKSSDKDFAMSAGLLFLQTT
jgi:hypothetical protein